ncbi:MAG: methyl-coenzyme M reductase I operon protein C [Methanoregulaceae archaeon]|nr:methyl-coenzyme M reductase I operon protein C [Methanoregulaceae archaeon]MCC7467879.1 methyl-coenzyme M reductase I operon protein C [Burkholderiaceae bacterium]NLH26603.1 methyl-coenzyme M reductase I operon protein C [Methanomicrobiales archaeon]HPS23536.1 methyl-coenzyme M reductase I operon protein C [Methanoregulaceae archaeon]
MPVGRVTQVVDCRAAMGMGKGGGIAQRGTISECRYPDVIVVGMSPGRRHVTKPVCDITSALRREGIEYSISTLVLNAGSGVPPDARDIGGGVLGAYFGLTDTEIQQIEKHKVAILHHGNVRSHVVHKVRFMLQACDVKAVVVSQAPVDFEDFAKVGVKTALVMPPPDKIKTRGTVMAIVSGVTRGQTPSREKMAEVIHAVMRLIKTKE